MNRSDNLPNKMLGERQIVTLRAGPRNCRPRRRARQAIAHLTPITFQAGADPHPAYCLPH